MLPIELVFQEIARRFSEPSGVPGRVRLTTQSDFYSGPVGTTSPKNNLQGPSHSDPNSPAPYIQVKVPGGVPLADEIRLRKDKHGIYQLVELMTRTIGTSTEDDLSTTAKPIMGDVLFFTRPQDMEPAHQKPSSQSSNISQTQTSGIRESSPGKPTVTTSSVVKTDLVHARRSTTEKDKVKDIAQVDKITPAPATAIGALPNQSEKKSSKEETIDPQKIIQDLEKAQTVQSKDFTSAHNPLLVSGNVPSLLVGTSLFRRIGVEQPFAQLLQELETEVLIFRETLDILFERHAIGNVSKFGSYDSNFWREPFVEENIKRDLGFARGTIVLETIRYILAISVPLRADFEKLHAKIVSPSAGCLAFHTNILKLYSKLLLIKTAFERHT